MDNSHYIYDVFISYSHADQAWVRDWLLPRLEASDLRVCIDFRDFDIGVPSLTNVERAVDNSRCTLLVLTPAWVESEWTEFEALLTQTTDPAGRQQRLLPLLLHSCRPPRRIAMLTYADFTQQEEWETQLQRVVAAAWGKLRLPEVGPPLSHLLRPYEDGLRPWPVWWFVLGFLVILIPVAVLVATTLKPMPEMTLSIKLNGEASQGEQTLTRNVTFIRVEAEILSDGTPVPPGRFDYKWSFKPSDTQNKDKDWSKVNAIDYYPPQGLQYQVLTIQVRGSGRQWDRSIHFTIKE